jgi:hypothetical protein
VGENTSLYLGAYFDVQTLWAEVKSILKRFAPPMHAQLMQQLNAPGLPVHPERDVIQTLGKRWYVYLPEDLMSTTPPRELNLLVAAELDSPDTLEAAVEKLLRGAPPGVVKTVSFGGKTIYQGPPVGSPAPGSEVTPPRPTLAFLGGKLILTTNLAMARQAVSDLERSRSPLLKSRVFNDTLKHMLPRPAVFFYVDQRRVGEYIWKFLSAALQTRGLAFEAGGPSSAQEGVALPTWETVRKYLSVAAFTAKWDDDGMRTRFWMPFPEAE